MKKQLFTLIALCSLCFVGCNSTHSNKKNLVEDDNISLEVTLERNMSSPYPLDIIYKLTNLSDKTVYYSQYDVPISRDMFRVIEDSITVQYLGSLALTLGISFDALEPGNTLSIAVPIDKYYKINKGTHNYKISLKNNSILAKISDGKSESFSEEPLEPNGLNAKNATSHEVNITSNTLEFEATIQNIRKPEDN